MSKGKTKYVLLGLIAKKPQSGYDIKKFIDQAVHYFWNESYGQIYPMLKALVAEGLATVDTQEQEGKPDKNIYAITEKGVEVMKEWLLEPAEEAPARYEVLLKLYFGNHIGVNQNIEHLQQFKDEQEKKLDIFKDIENHLIHVCANHPEKIYSLLTVRFGINECLFRINWCETSIAALKSQSSTGVITNTGV